MPNASSTEQHSQAPDAVTDPLWFKKAIIYEIPIRAYCDSNADGIGDINGVISKLDYLVELGVTALWLLPFYPSPLRDGGYDISDYTSVHPMYGSLDDFKELLKQAKSRGIRIITELVINHTSSEHPWFQRARTSPKGSKWRDFYVWSDDDDRYKDARIIFRDFEASNWTWDKEADAFYWHRFYSHQPDLNFDNPDVHQAVFDAMDFWFEMGVDGLRLDAIPYLYERDETNCENLPETHAFLKKLRKHIDDRFPDKMLLAEANQWPADAAAYFGDGDECHMNFHFPLMPRMFMAVQLEDQFPIVDILRQTPSIPDSCQWATFLRNHDELTLEMVTDEDRDYMYRSYAQDPTARLNLGIRRRLAPLLGTRQKVELLNGLLFSLPGTPVLYYGDEIGMGDNIYLGDRDGVRTPMQWSADRNAGFSQANPQKLYLPVISDPEYRYEAVNVQAQETNSSSLLWWMKRTIELRKQYPALGSGELEVIPTENSKILAFLRILDDEKVLVVANLSRFHQCVELDLQRFVGATPIELSGLVRFPRVESAPYRLSIGPFGFLWFTLEPQRAPAGAKTAPARAQLSEPGQIFTKGRKQLNAALAAWVPERRWFRSKTRSWRSSRVEDVLMVESSPNQAILIFRIEFSDAELQRYLVPVALVQDELLTEVETRSPHDLIMYLDGTGEQVALVDSTATAGGAELLLSLVQKRVTAVGSGQVHGAPQPPLQAVGPDQVPPPKFGQLEQTNSTVLFGEQFLLKIYRQVEFGVHAELEIGAFLAQHAPLCPAAKVLGSLTYQTASEAEPAAIALVQEFVPNQGTAWDITIDRVGAYFDRVLSSPGLTPGAGPVMPRITGVDAAASHEISDLIGPYLSEVRLLGQRTAEVHLALSSQPQISSFAPEPFSVMHQQSIYQWTRALMVKTFSALRKKLPSLPADIQPIALELLSKEGQIEQQLQKITAVKLSAERIRCHGDLHLGQVLHTGDDFVIIDFEGEPARPLNERAYKRCALRDVMGMVRSFNYATESVLRGGRYRDRDVEVLRPWSRLWESDVRASYLDGYLKTAQGASFVPQQEAHVNLLFTFYGIEKALYEIGYEMNNRPSWLPIPVAGLTQLLEAEQNHA